MTKRLDESFFRNLILHCLDYVPYLLEGPTQDHPDMKTFRTIRSAVNIIRSDYYSWFLALISSIAEKDYRRSFNLAAQVSCLNLSDKNEELLLLCSVLVQISHFIIMKHKCLESVYSTARCLSKVFDEKHRKRLGETGWSEFEKHCEAILVQRESESGPLRADHEIEAVVRREMTPWCKNVNEKNILNFWEKRELKKLAAVAKEELDVMRWRDTLPITLNRKKIVVVRTYNPYLKSRIVNFRPLSWETQKSDPGWKKCETATRTGFCLGCFLTVFYPEAKNKTPKVKHLTMCQLWTDKMKKGGNGPKKLKNAVPLITAEPKTRELCATEIPRLPELLLNFVQKNLDNIFGTHVLKKLRNKMFNELDVDVETCKLCETQCMRKLIIGMDLYLHGCGHKL